VVAPGDPFSMPCPNHGTGAPVALFKRADSEMMGEHPQATDGWKTLGATTSLKHICRNYEEIKRHVILNLSFSKGKDAN